MQAEGDLDDPRVYEAVAELQAHRYHQAVANETRQPVIVDSVPPTAVWPNEDEGQPPVDVTKLPGTGRRLQAVPGVEITPDAG